VLMSDKEQVSGIPWPVRSPNLTVPDFFLYGDWKECVHATQELQGAVLCATATISQELLGRGYDIL